MIYYGGVDHLLVHTLSEEQAFTSPASDHSTEQAKKPEDSEWHLFNEHPEGKAQQDPSHCPM